MSRSSGSRQASLLTHISRILMLFILIILLPGNARAGLLLDAQLRFTYEDNVIGLLSDQGVGKGSSGGGGGMMLAAGPMGGGMGGGNGRYTGSGSGSTQSPGDFSVTIGAEAGGYTNTGENSSVFAKGIAENKTYDTYTALDETLIGAAAGANLGLSDNVFANATALAKIKSFNDSQRNSTAYGGVVSLKERLSPESWIKEFGEYEKNHASNASFSYDGTTVGISAGYAFAKKLLATIGYSYLLQKFDEPSGAEMKTNTVFAGLEYAVRRNWSVSGEYDMQIAKENITGSSTTDNVFSLALRYSY